ncbi:expressed unknown protein [Seminavis robusta]|uniref:Endonuclease/exonuclease/phosphatase domain-containing protein n=1 Tax=Seminavis robusta TaxID=568900 RepID=A0A9N8H831_9STRA|nr:expressed unknown protein [Seminavis robusta]|eukprot:Sro147_g067790.1 n/a (302) ;mRNA; r:40658-41563
MMNSPNFTVATYNVFYVCKAPTNQQVLDTILRCDKDVVTLQEVNDEWESFVTSSVLSDVYPHIRFHNPPGNSWAGYAVLSKHPIKRWTVIPKTERWWYPAGCVTLQIPTHQEPEHPFQTLQLLVVHLRAPVEISVEPYWWGGHANWIGGFFSQRVKQKRLHEMQTFASALDPSLPTVVVGDFNERRWNSPCLQYLTQDLGMVALDKVNKGGTWFGSSFCLGGRCCTNSWSFELCNGMIPLLALDYDHVVYSPGLLECVGNVATIHQDSRGSDHRLVSAEFQFTNPKKSLALPIEISGNNRL